MPHPIEACEWLTLLESSHLSQPTQLLISEINRAIEEKDNERVRQLVTRLLKLRDSLPDRMEKAETTLESGVALYQLGDCERAIERLEEARQLYRNNLHYTTVALWMIGCIQWELPAEHDKAYSAWSQCIAQFETLQRSSGNASHARWYAERVRQINADIESALKQEQPAKPAPQPEPIPLPGPVTAPEASQVLESTQSGGQILLQLFRVVEVIPAGGFGRVGFRPYTIGEVDTDRVIINGEPYRMTNIRPTGKVIALRSSSYVVLKVTGDSMNRPGKIGEEGIDPDDFVLLHLQDVASDGDIVAAEIDGIDSRATLKRLRILQEGREYSLEPQSTNPIHQARTFGQMNQGFRVRGIVLVVFKPFHSKS